MLCRVFLLIFLNQISASMIQVQQSVDSMRVMNSLLIDITEIAPHRVDDVTITHRTKWSEVENHHTWKLLSQFECGDSAADRIIGGVTAALGQFPWIVRLGYNTSDMDELDWMCGGALVSDRHVVTAAHCVQTDADDEIQLDSIRFGEYDARTDPDCLFGVCAPKLQDRRVGRIYLHPYFNKPAFHNDIAVIALDRPVVINDYISPVCLPRKDQLANILKIGELVTVAGWGKMNMSTEERADVLQVISLPVVSPGACDTFGKRFKLLESEVCAGGQRNRDACGGDSGGPLMKVYDTPDGPKHFLIGVVSFGPTLCGIKKPGVYASVPHFLKWILDNIV